jgi:hypothetical protein
MKTLFIAFVSILATGCAGVKVASIQNPNIDLGKYDTFCWIQGCEVKYQGPDYGYNPERMQLLQEIIKAELESKGLTNDKNAPDLLVGFHVILEEKETILIKNREMIDPYGRQVSYWNGYDEYFKQEIYRFLKGSLIIDLIDAETGSVVWQTTAQRYMDLGERIDRNKMTKGIRKALKEYPSKMEATGPK